MEHKRNTRAQGALAAHNDIELVGLDRVKRVYMGQSPFLQYKTQVKMSDEFRRNIGEEFTDGYCFVINLKERGG